MLNYFSASSTKFLYGLEAITEDAVGSYASSLHFCRIMIRFVVLIFLVYIS